MKSSLYTQCSIAFTTIVYGKKIPGKPSGATDGNQPKSQDEYADGDISCRQRTITTSSTTTIDTARDSTQWPLQGPKHCQRARSK